MATKESLKKHGSLFLSNRRSEYPTLSGIYHATASLPESVRGTNLTDKLGLAGTLLIYPEFSAQRGDLQHIITLGHQIDHYVDSADLVNSNALRNFNTLYPELLKKHYANDKSLIKSILGFYSQAIVIEKNARGLPADDMCIENCKYRELINAVWVRMVVSVGTRLHGGENDPSSFIPIHDLHDAYDLYKDFINGLENKDLPSKKQYVLFLWTMAIQQKFDSISRYRNNVNKNPFIEHSQRDYILLATEQGVNPLILQGTLSFIDTLPYLQRLQRF